MSINSIKFINNLWTKISNRSYASKLVKDIKKIDKIEDDIKNNIPINFKGNNSKEKQFLEELLTSAQMNADSFIDDIQYNLPGKLIKNISSLLFWTINFVVTYYAVKYEKQNLNINAFSDLIVIGIISLMIWSVIKGVFYLFNQIRINKRVMYVKVIEKMIKQRTK